MQRTRVVSTDDLDGNQTLSFGLDGIQYEIDLSKKNVGRLRAAFDSAHATKS